MSARTRQAFWRSVTKASRHLLWDLVCVGAGLPAMQTPRCISDTQVMLSQASQLPHLPSLG
ncbi:hypothetical protein FEM54_04700 [Pseudomonas edaphica]|uniref:Uncharacterized protein n=1 Tax=Pseudomonas edaphica TaxID=2006980 RepID=A0ABY2UA69_9PSED|nr:hypothetical protein FEM54_04700 [Pseudomonas edaphica]